MKRPLVKTREGSSSSTLRTAAQAWGCSLQAAGSMAESAKTHERRSEEKGLKHKGVCA